MAKSGIRFKKLYLILEEMVVKKRLLLCIAIILFLTGCSMGAVEDADEITINEMLSFWEVKPGSSVTITDAGDIEVLIEGIESAKKEPGMADVMDPEFELLIGDRKFYLWFIGEGTVMDQEDTHTIYTLKNGVREQFEEIVLPEFE